jgi:hypothetical protein
MNNRIRLELGGLDAEGYNKLVVLISIDDKYIALLNQEAGVENLEIEFFEKTKLKKVEYDLFLEALVEAKKFLLNE